MKKQIKISFFWLIIIALSILPLSLTRLDIPLYLLPQLEVAVTFFLSVYANIYPVQFFLYGILIDISYGYKIGISSLILLLINKIISRFKPNLSRQNIKTILFYYAFTYILTALFKYIIFVFESGLLDKSSLAFIGMNIMINILYYPFIHWTLLHSPYINTPQIKK